MSIISTKRHSSPHTTVTRIGQPKPAKPVASKNEADEIAKAISSLSKARIATTETEFTFHVSEAFRIARQIVRSRTLSPVT
jgi:hypothetical protein